MSVLMSLRVKGDPAKLEEIARETPTKLQAIAERAKAGGCISHRFYGSDDGEFMVVDEWESPEDFQRFFGSSPDIGEVMQAVGVTSEPEVRFWRKLETGDQF